MKLLNDLLWRYAVKKFSEKKVANQELKMLLHAPRLSASSYGLQPYRIIVVESNELRKQLLPFSYGQDKILNSSHLVIFAAHNDVGESTVNRYIAKHAQVTKKTPDQLANFSEHMKSALADKTQNEQQQWAHQQAYIALGNFLTCAAAMKIDSCPMTGIDTAGYDEVLGLADKGLTTTVICPIGYRHQEDVQALAPKVRFDYDEIVLTI